VNQAAHRLDRFAFAALLVLPAFLLHGRGIADTLLVLVGLAFLGSCALRRDWNWLRCGWVPIGLAWWLWLVLCSVPGIGIGGWLSFGHALAAVRLPVFVAALEQRLLRTPRARRWIGRVIAAAALYIGLSAWLQFATGRDLMGWHRAPDGELTGPFWRPRAGPALSHLLFPALLPPAYRLLGGSLVQRAAAVVLAVVSVGIVVLIGQRMPALLTGMGLIVAGLLLPRLRATLVAALVAAGLLLGASFVVSPPVWYRLVTKFSTQMEHFWHSDYGLIYHRAIQIAVHHPVLGRGYAGFRNGCGTATYCNLHPHSYYLEAATDSGLPGLALFSLLDRPDPLRVGLFVAVLIQAWPIASTTSFYAIELTGFFLILLGWGLVEAKSAAASSTSSTEPSAATPST
jgi:hypothetical protein